MPVTFEMTNWTGDTTMEVVDPNWTSSTSYPVLDPQLEEFVEQMEYNETLLDNNMEDDVVRQDLSRAQFITVFVVTTFASLLSIVGSSLIVVTVVRRRRSKQQQLQNNTLFQFLLGLSICDIVLSLSSLLGTFAMPVDQRKTHSLAVGNDATCSAMAFITLVAGTGGAFYNCWISLHFWRTVQPQRSQQKDGWLRAGCHSSTAIICLLLGVAGFVVDGYGPHPFLEVCYTVGTLGKRIGKLRTLIMAILTLAATYFTASLVRTVRISIRKSEQYTKRSMSIQSGSGSVQSVTGAANAVAGGVGAQRYAMEGSQTTKTTYAMGASQNTTTGGGNAENNGTGAGAEDTTTNNDEMSNLQRESALMGNSNVLPARQNHQQRQRTASVLGSSAAAFIQRTRSGESIGRGSVRSSATSNTKGRKEKNKKDAEVASQACWYYAAYLNTVLVPVIAIVVMNGTDAYNNPGKPQYFFFLLCVVFCVPIQGALNFAVFIRPRYNSWREYYEREQEELEARQARLPTIQDDRKTSGGTMPSFVTILTKAVLEDVPKRRKRRIMPVSGASNVSAISAPSGMSSRFSTNSRASFANQSSNELVSPEGLPESEAEPAVASINAGEGILASKPQLLSPSSTEEPTSSAEFPGEKPDETREIQTEEEDEYHDEDREVIGINNEQLGSLEHHDDLEANDNPDERGPSSGHTLHDSGTTETEIDTVGP